MEKQSATNIVNQLSKNDIETLKPLVAEAIQGMEIPNTKVYHLAVYGVITIALALVLGSLAIIIFKSGTEIPDFFAVTLGTAIGAIAGMLVPTDA